MKLLISDKPLTKFFQKLQSAKSTQIAGTTAEIVVLELEEDDKLILGCPPATGSRFRFLLREEYERVWNDIQSSFHEGRSKAIVVGTAGIGKSLFRFFICRKWLLNGNRIGESDFEDIRFNVGQHYYVLRRNGTVFKVNSFELCNTRSLALLEPCREIDRVKELLYRLTVVITSPSPLMANGTQSSVTQLTKVARIYVMRLWTIDEWHHVHPHGDRDLEKNFCSEENGQILCVPRWLTYENMTEAEELLEASKSQTSARALLNFIRNGRVGAIFPDNDLPYRLCKIIESRHGWTIDGFISDFVIWRIIEWSQVTENMLKENFKSFLQHPWTGSLLGQWFESWAFDALTNGKQLLVKANDVERKFSFHSIQNVEDATKAEAVLDFEAGILYRPKQRNFASIDGYGLVGNCLVMLQFTVSPSHSDAKFQDVRNIIEQARAKYETKNKVQVLMVYVMPDPNEFRVPGCSSLAHANVSVVAGRVDSDFFPALKKQIRLQDFIIDRKQKGPVGNVDD